MLTNAHTAWQREYRRTAAGRAALRRYQASLRYRLVQGRWRAGDRLRKAIARGAGDRAIGRIAATFGAYETELAKLNRRAEPWGSSR